MTSSDTTTLPRQSPTGRHGTATAVEDLRSRVQALVPSITGMSVTVVDGGSPFTAAASDPRTAALDAVQYVEGGPAVTSTVERRDVEVTDTLDDDAVSEWGVFTAAATARDIRSTFSVTAPATEGTSVTVTFLATEPHAFAAVQRDVRDLVDRLPAATFTGGAPIPPTALGASARDLDLVEQAVGVVAAAAGVSLGEAQQLLPDAAARAQVDVAAAARAVLGED
ncbi:hypothetical protein [Actinotalea sp. Marseille-Q4924]|uniref:hypothetical protein n=1 Tax=Actinotalea sp. Marseille-Q4924 TaxID=2866571 RepID=UPI001CE3ECDE|nr:hypothetical protein [Actinotalea sp. Marseille-Q4924]